VRDNGGVCATELDELTVLQVLLGLSVNVAPNMMGRGLWRVELDGGFTGKLPSVGAGGGSLGTGVADGGAKT
jgi:hypothetical protein